MLQFHKKSPAFESSRVKILVPCCCLLTLLHKQLQNNFWHWTVYNSNYLACTNLYVCNGLVTRPAASITGRTAAQANCLPTYQPTSHYRSQDVSLADKVSIKKRRKEKEYRRNNTHCSTSVSMATLCFKRAWFYF